MQNITPNKKQSLRALAIEIANPNSIRGQGDEYKKILSFMFPTKKDQKWIEPLWTDEAHTILSENLAEKGLIDDNGRATF